MKNSMYKILLLILLSSISYSQPPRKLMERIQTVKKIKLLDVLDLNEDDSEKLLVKYNSFENKFTEKIQEFDEVEEKLESAIRDENKKEIIQYTKQFETLKLEIYQISANKDQAMKSILNEEKYALYLIFEKRFKKEISKELMGRGRERRRR